MTDTPSDLPPDPYEPGNDELVPVEEPEDLPTEDEIREAFETAPPLEQLPDPEGPPMEDPDPSTPEAS